MRTGIKRTVEATVNTFKLKIEPIIKSTPTTRNNNRIFLFVFTFTVINNQQIAANFTEK
jgi:hypothetical protein